MHRWPARRRMLLIASTGSRAALTTISGTAFCSVKAASREAMQDKRLDSTTRSRARVCTGSQCNISLRSAWKLRRQSDFGRRAVISRTSRGTR